VVVMDIRHPLTEFDRQMIAWGVAAQRPMLLLLTKADKLGRGAAQSTVAQVRRSVADAGAPILVQAFSATNRLGLDEAQGQLSQWLELPPLF
jgi:GTP-binding protein